MTPRHRLLFGLLAALALPCAAGAQNPQPAPPNEEHPTVAPPNAPNPPPERIAPADGGAGSTTLSERLSAQQGTLKPPSVDPGINVPVPAPTQGTMPVIPPPGTPGGDQRIVPK